MPKSDYERIKEWRSRPENKGKRAAEARRWRAKHSELYKEIRKRYRAAHLDELRAREREAVAKRRQADPEGQRRRVAAFKARKEAKRVAEAGRPRPSICDLCRENNGGIVFDHCHVAGHFRGWLCDRCNKVLGLVRDDPRLLRRMAGYLGRWRNGKADHKVSQETPIERLCAEREALSG